MENICLSAISAYQQLSPVLIRRGGRRDGGDIRHRLASAWHGGMPHGNSQVVLYTYCPVMLAAWNVTPALRLPVSLVVWTSGRRVNALEAVRGGQSLASIP